MDFYNQLLAQKLGGGGGAYKYDAFKARTDTSINNVTAQMLQGISDITDYAFNYCTSLASIEIPNSVTNIENGAFYNCTSLSSVTVEATNPPTLGGSTFGIDANLTIYVPAESVDTYKAASGWSNYASKIQAIPSD